MEYKFLALGLFWGALICALLLVFGNPANAYEVPQDAVIKVFDASGKQIGEMSRSEYKVVKLGTSMIRYSYVREPILIERPNTVIIHAGHGRTGSDDATRMVFGATYCRTRSDTGICVTGFDNETVVFGVKRDF